MLCNPAGEKATYDSAVAVQKKLEAARQKVNENRYSLRVHLSCVEHNDYYVEFVGTYDDVKKRYAQALQNLREGKWEYEDTVGLANRHIECNYAEGSCFVDPRSYPLKDFNKMIEKVEKDYDPW